MLDILRDSTIGHILNSFSNGRILPYADQRPDFEIPARYLDKSVRLQFPSPSGSEVSLASTKVGIPPPSYHTSQREFYGGAVATSEDKLEAGDADRDTLNSIDDKKKADVPSQVVIVDWYGPSDPENPKNWGSAKRGFVLATIVLLTLSVYAGAAIFTPSIPGVMEDFGVSLTVATLGLSLYVIGYGIGPMILCPAQEVASFGRNPIYAITLTIFVGLQIAAALSTNITGLLVIRFFSGFFASPALATGGASICDMYGERQVPYGIALWAMAATGAPVLGPLVGSFVAAAHGWRWPMWVLLWISFGTLVVLVFLLPETMGDSILLKRAARLRKLTGNPNLRSMSEIKEAQLSKKTFVYESCIRPFQLMLEPSIFFLNFYTGLSYSVFYLFFEAFTIVFTDIYHIPFNLTGLPYLGILIGGVASCAFYMGYIRWSLIPRWNRNGSIVPEDRLRLTMYSGLFMPVALLIFGWTARANIHWIVPILATALYMPSIYILFQGALTYMPVSYPGYEASVLASNAFVRCGMAAAFPLFGRAFFEALGMGVACSILAGVSVLMLPALWILIQNGAKLRAMSKYATA